MIIVTAHLSTFFGMKKFTVLSSHSILRGRRLALN